MGDWNLLEWIVEHSGRDDSWLVIIIDDNQNWALFGRHYKYITGRFTEPGTDSAYPFQGIHQKNVCIAVNWGDQPDYVRNHLKGLLTAKGAFATPYPLRSEEREVG